MVLHKFLLAPSLALEDFDKLSERVLQRVVRLYLASAYPNVDGVTGSAVYRTFRNAIRSEVEDSLKKFNESVGPAFKRFQEMMKNIGPSLQQLSPAISRIQDYQSTLQNLVEPRSQSYTGLLDAVVGTTLPTPLPALLPLPPATPTRVPTGLLEDSYVGDDEWDADGDDAEDDRERWAKVDRQVERAWERLADASAGEDCQSVGHLCREILISLAEAVYVRERHPPVDGVEPSATDAKRRLEAYIAVEFRGRSHKAMRKSMRACVDQAVELQHDRNATETEAATCLIATQAVVDLIREGARAGQS